MSIITSNEFNAEKILSIIAEGQEFVKYNFEILNASAPGENFSAVALLATITGIKSDNSKETLKVFIKHPPYIEAIREALKVETTFQNETVSYNTLIPALYKLQDTINMDLSDRFSVPRILKASFEDHKEFIAMEDISVNGFQKYDHLKSLDYTHLRLLIKKIANYHATVFAFKTFQRKNYDELVGRISEDIYYSTNGNKNVIIMSNVLLMNAKNFLDQPEEIEAIDKILDDLSNRMHYLTSRRGAEPYDVICHGDFWMSNFWFKYENNVPKDVCFFDWQIIRCGSLFTDLHYMMFLCTDGETRKKYHSAVFDWYYSDLGDVLQKFGLEIDNVYPRDEFKKDERKFAAFGLAVAISYTLILTADPTNLPDIQELTSGNVDKIKHQTTKISVKGKQRIKEIIADYVSKGYN